MLEKPVRRRGGGTEQVDASRSPRHGGEIADDLAPERLPAPAGPAVVAPAVLELTLLVTDEHVKAPEPPRGEGRAGRGEAVGSAGDRFPPRPALAVPDVVEEAA